MYTLITDGAYSSSRDCGGFAFIMLKDNIPILEYSKSVKNTTNNKMELMAIIFGLKSIKKPIDSLLIVSDSEYCIGCAVKGWTRSKNKKLWEIFEEEFNRVLSLCSDITWKHVKGHQKDDGEFTKWNNYVDKLAVLKTR